MTDRRIAILGAGPIGVEAALFALEHGFEVDLYEKEKPGAHVAQWDHVRLFSPWEMNRSEWGERALREAGHELAPADEFPTGREYLDRYLLPLAKLEKLAAVLHEQTAVLGVSREDAFKGDYIGDSHRSEGPFLLLVEDANGRRYERADIVLDTTGVYDQPRHLGPGGLPALGEEDLDALVERHIPDPLGKERPVYANRATLLVGNGYSAVTSAHLLAQLHENAPDTKVYWLLLDDEPPYPPIPDDPLTARLELSEFGNKAARGHVAGVEPVFGGLRRLERDGEQVHAHVDLLEGEKELAVDRVVANVGYMPDVSLYRELQIHQCYASEGPMKLAAHLLSQQGGAGDCLQQSAGGFETLVNPEPNFYILGAKSYGRNSDFLLKLGFEQIQHVFNNLDDV